uniref:RNase H type-1 domain-containing protein n=1 Tax=Cannabis sativa TaxID=3483 RepID=A0A803PJ37_CANSA
MAHSWIPTNSALAHRHIQVEPYCKQCATGAYENVFHALWGCRVNREVCNGAGFYGKIQRQGREDVLAFLMRISSSFTKDESEFFLVLSWNLWYIRNSVNHGGHKPQASAILEWGSKFLQEFRERVKVGEGIAGLSSVVRDHEVNLVMKEEEGCRDVDGLIAQIKWLLQNERVAGISFAFREANQVAHILANDALINKASAMWVGVVPLCASQAIRRDLPYPL